MFHKQEIEQKFHTYSKLNKRKVLVLFLCLSLCASFFAFPVYAFDSPVDGSWAGQPLPLEQQSATNNEKWDSAFSPVSYISGVDEWRYSVDRTALSDVYFVLAPDPSSSLYYIAYVGSTSDFYLYELRKPVSGSISARFNSFHSSFDSSLNLYIYQFTNRFRIDQISDISAPFYSSADDAKSALAYVCQNGISDPGPELEPFSYSLAPGNVIFIDVSGSDPTDVAVLTSSTGFSYSASELQNTNQAFGYLDSIPSSFTLPLSGTNNIPWAPAGNANLYGKYQHKTRSVYAYSSNHQYFVVVNPTYDPYTLASGVVGDNVAFAYDNSNATNSYIDISGFSARAFKVYSLNSQLIYDSGGWSSVTESDGPSYSGSYDSSTQTWTTVNDTSGESESPPLGGTNNIESDATTSETIFAWLETIASSIGSFFRGSIGAVTSLVASGSEFFRSISGLYSWLPSPVLSVLLNALIIAITIGVIKVFI